MLHLALRLGDPQGGLAVLQSGSDIAQVNCWGVMYGLPKSVLARVAQLQRRRSTLILADN
jgi:hypothetical protein